jgi:TonB-dependent receptor
MRPAYAPTRLFDYVSNLNGVFVLKTLKIISVSVLAFILADALLSTPASAQGGKGSIAGTVKDSAGGPLRSASVEIQSLGRKAVSDDQGEFLISDLPPAEYTLMVTYVGFATTSTTVKVESGKIVNADIVLSVASQSDMVIVTAERVQGEAEAINIERLSDNIVQVLPERVINSLPNTNIADAVGRAPSVTLERDEGEGKYVQIRGTEPRLTNTTINGVNVPSVEGTVRNIKLDSVPANLVERIEVFKTLSADQDADGIGGTVNLVTRTAQERLTYNVGGSGGYTPIQGGRTLGEFDANAGRRFGPDKKFGFLLGGTFDRNNRGINDLEPSPTSTGPNGSAVAYFSGEDQRSYSYYRTRYGFATGLDYSLKPGSNIYVKGLYSDFHDYGETWVYTPNAGGFLSANGSKVNFDNTGSYQYRHYIRRPDQQVFSILAGARHDLGANLFTYEFAGSRSHNIGGQDFPTTNFNGNSAVTLQLDQSDPYRPKFNALDGTSLFDPTQYTVTKTIFPKYHATQVNFQGAAAWSRRYSAHSHFGVFEMGVKVRNSHGTQNEFDNLFAVSGTGSFGLSQVLGTYTNQTYYDGTFAINGLGYGPTSDYKKIQQAIATDLAGPKTLAFQQVASVQKSEGAFFDANERIYAGYIQNAISFGKFRVQGGVRFDAADTNFTTHHVDATVTDSSGNLIIPTTIQTCPSPGTPSSSSICKFSQSGSYFNALPSVQVQYNFEKNTNLRLNYSRGISRPNIGDLVPTQIVDPNFSPKQVVIGNSTLQPTKANNYDVLVEHYFQPLGIIQAGFFYKQLSDPIYPTVKLIGNNDPNFPGLGGYRLLQSVNGPNAHIAGFEAAWEQRLSHLPGLLNGFGVSANYGYTTSQVDFPAFFSPSTPGGEGRIDHPALPRQAPNTWNLGLTYDKSRFSMRFAVSHNDTSIFAYNYAHADAATDKDPINGIHGPNGDVYFYAHTQFDIQGSYRIYKGLRFFAYGLNLSNEVFGFYQGSKIYPNQREYYHPTVAFGMRWTSGSE